MKYCENRSKHGDLGEKPRGGVLSGEEGSSGGKGASRGEGTSVELKELSSEPS